MVFTETILIAEDDEAFRDTLYRILTKYGYRVLVTPNGAEALDAARHYTGPIHMLCTNIEMPPGIGGLELARRLAAERPDTKVLYVTGSNKPLFSLLRKPFTEEELIAGVRETLEPPPLEKAVESGE